MSVDMIIASLPDKTAEACDRFRQNALRQLAGGTEAQKADAERLLDALASLDETSNLTPYDDLSEDEIAQRISHAFARRPMTETDATVIQALLDHPGSTSTHLSKVCGWKGQVWQAHFGAMCHARMPDLWPTEGVQSWGAPFYSGLFATFDPDGNRFTMRPAVRAALAALGMKPHPTRPT